MVKYKPGQLVTLNGYIYRIRKGPGCIGCVLFHLIKDPEHPQFCIQSKLDPTNYGLDPSKGELCRKSMQENSFPQFIKINPLCVK